MLIRGKIYISGRNAKYYFGGFTMRHETLEKLCAAVEYERSDPRPYDIWLTDDTANQLMAEADDVKLRGGTLVLSFDDTDVVLKVEGILVAGDIRCYVQVLCIGDVYAKPREDTRKKRCIHL